MSHEHSQPDMPDYRLQANYAQSSAGMWTDIGEAEITHTIFGRAKVHIIRKHDKAHRAMLLTAMALTVLAAVAWQGWLAFQQAEPPSNSEPSSALGADGQVDAPLSQLDAIDQSAAAAATRLKPSVPPPQAAIHHPAMGQQPVPPAASKPLPASKPQAAPVAADNSAVKNPTEMQQPIKPPFPGQPVVISPGTEPAANRSAAVVPQVKEDVSHLLHAGENSAATPGATQP